MTAPAIDLPTTATGRPVIELAAKILAADPVLLPEFAATAVAVDAHAMALKSALRRFDALEERLCRLVHQLDTQLPSEVEFAALLDYIGDSDIRVRVEKLQKAFPP